MKIFSISLPCAVAFGGLRTLLQVDPCAENVWDTDNVYVGGDVVVHNDKAYEACYWTKGQDPADPLMINGGTPSQCIVHGRPWKDLEIDCVEDVDLEDVDLDLVGRMVSALHSNIFNNVEGFGPDCIVIRNNIQVRCGRDVVGALLRLAFHDSATADADAGTGGADGCFDGTLSDHFGLEEIRDQLELAWEPFQAEVSRADFWVLAESMAIFLAGGPVVPYKMGREDCLDPANVDDSGLLPSANPPSTTAEPTVADHMRTHFSRMGLNDRDMVTLLGAHTVGNMKPENQGFSGQWDSSSHIFNTQYFQQLTSVVWEIEDVGLASESWFGGGGLRLLNVDAALVVEPDMGLAGPGRCDVFGPRNSCVESAASLRNVVAEFADQETGETAFFDQFKISFDKMVTAGQFANSLKLVDQTSLTAFYETHPPPAFGCSPNEDCDDPSEYCSGFSSACRGQGCADTLPRCDDDNQCVPRHAKGESCVDTADDAPCASGIVRRACGQGLICSAGICTDPVVIMQYAISPPGATHCAGSPISAWNNYGDHSLEECKTICLLDDACVFLLFREATGTSSGKCTQFSQCTTTFTSSDSTKVFHSFEKVHLNLS